MRITIKDIARELGIHHATVSRALRGDVRISSSTRQLVADYAAQQGYAVNQNALSLRNTSRNEIAVVVPNISHFTFSNFISRASDLAKSNGYVVSVFQSKENVDNEREIVNIIKQNRAAGVIASISNSTTDASHFGQLVDFGIPVVFFDRVPPDFPSHKVTTDNLDAAYKAVVYLAERGCRCIAHLTGPQHINVFSDRHSGYVKAIEEYGFGYRQQVVESKEFEITDGQQAMASLWRQAVKPDAVLCDSFSLSAGVNEFCRQNGIRVPADLSIVAIANDPFAALIDPPQTVFEQPLDEIAISAFDLLLSQIKQGGPETFENRLHKARLIERRSVRGI